MLQRKKIVKINKTFVQFDDIFIVFAEAKNCLNINQMLIGRDKSFVHLVL